MKHVWILNHYAQEPGGAGGTRHFSLARNLPRYGWTATIIAASTDHAAGRQRLGGTDQPRIDTYDGVPFLWLPTRSYSGNGRDRVANMLDYTRAVLRRRNLVGIKPPDAVIGSSVHPLAAWAGRRLARRYRVPFIFEVRDLWPQTLIDMGRISHNHPAAIGLRWLERSLYRSAERIIVLLPRAHDYIEPLGIARDKIVWISNGVELGDFPPTEPAARTDGFTLMYFGAHGGANGLDNVLRAMRLVQDSPAGDGICLRLIGDGPLKPSLVAQARDLGLSNVRFEASVPKKAIPEIAAGASAFVFNLIDAPVFKYGISSNKLFDFMAAQRPVIFCCDSSNNPIAESGGGVTVEPGNPEKLAAAILDVAHLSPSARLAMGRAARHHVEQQYGFSHLAAKLAATLDSSVASA